MRYSVIFGIFGKLKFFGSVDIQNTENEDCDENYIFLVFVNIESYDYISSKTKHKNKKCIYKYICEIIFYIIIN